MISSALRARRVHGLSSPDRFPIGYQAILLKALDFRSNASRVPVIRSAEFVFPAFQRLSFSTTNQRAYLELRQHNHAHSREAIYSRPRPLESGTFPRVFPLFNISEGHFSTKNPNPKKRSQVSPNHLSFYFSSSALFSSHFPSHCCVPGLQGFSSSATNMATSGKVDLNSPSTSWKEAKNFLKTLNNKQRREHYSIKDFIKLKEIPTWKDAAKKLKVKQPEEAKYPKNKDLIEKISVFRGDITKLEIDAIVNTANSSLLGGGGVDGCIHRAAGPLLKLECSSLGGCETGQAKLTCGYFLPAKWVIHTVGPVAQGQPGASQEEELKNCYKNSLKVAVEAKCRTVAFPCISTGVFGYPSEAAADVALTTLRNYLEENKDKIDQVIICVFLEKDEEIYLRKMPEYFPIA
ncbi:ADP-ribose glycohydrolase MACROD1 isoform 2-T2 [Discoglossus pictus]